MTIEHQNGVETAAAPLKVGLLMLPQFSHLGLGLVVEPMFIANWLNQSSLFHWTRVSVDGGPVESSNGFVMSSDSAITSSGRFDAVFVFASFESRKHAKNQATLNWLRKQARFGADICGVETGSEILAAAGLIDNLDAAVHWDNIKGFSELYPQVTAKQQLYCITDRRLSCAGGMSVADMTLNWMTKILSNSLVNEISEHLLMNEIRGPDKVQLHAPVSDADQTFSPVIQQAVKLMRDNLEGPISCEKIANWIGLKRRKFERQFRKETNESPLRFYLKLRLAKAHRLLQQTELSVVDVAIESGFNSPEHFSRKYREMFGRPPSADREQSTNSPVMRRLIDQEKTMLSD